METPPSEKPSLDLTPLLDIFIAPARAFVRIGKKPQWGQAYALVVILNVVAFVLIWPAIAHIIAVNPALQDKSAKGIAEAQREAREGQIFFTVFLPYIQWGLCAAFLTLFSRASQAPIRAFNVFFALAAYTSLPSAVGTVLQGIIIAVHGPSAYHSFAELNLALPDSLALLHPNGQARELAFLGYWDVFDVWSLSLLGLGFATLNKLDPAAGLRIAYSLGLVYALLGALLT
ncbi:MAG TPA: YIP1 family protein [Candidatus Baltobacteraceae bacterium]|jgi:hypothetical protein|nr:YIP1 family protein [Candidatus Baltobacteraceae bacterium]